MSKTQTKNAVKISANMGKGGTFQDEQTAIDRSGKM